MHVVSVLVLAQVKCHLRRVQRKTYMQRSIYELTKPWTVLMQLLERLSHCS